MSKIRSVENAEYGKWGVWKMSMVIKSRRSSL